MKLPGITKRAARAISKLMLLWSEKQREEWLPVIAWLIGSNEPGFVPGPCLGGHPAEKVPSQWIVEAHGIIVVYNLPPDILEKYQDCVLDYMGNQFMFIEPSAVKFLGEDL
jgi:hypothetical protein